MNWSQILFIFSIIFTILCVILFFIIPGFPLFIFFFIPPIFCWSQKGQKDSYFSPSTCPNCGKLLLEPQENYCPHCGYKIRE